MTSILILEDDISFFYDIKILLSKLGYHELTHVTNLIEFEREINNNEFAIILADIYIGQNTSFHVVNRVKPSTPIIYLTAFKTENIYEELQIEKKHFVLTKPFDIIILKSAIDILLDKEKIIELTDGSKKIKVLLDELCYIKAVGNYLEFQTVNNKFLIRGVLKLIETQLPSKLFFKPHRSYLVNEEKIKSIDLKSLNIEICDLKIPISRLEKENMKIRFNL